MIWSGPYNFCERGFNLLILKVGSEITCLCWVPTLSGIFSTSIEVNGKCLMLFT